MSQLKSRWVYAYLAAVLLAQVASAMVFGGSLADVPFRMSFAVISIAVILAIWALFPTRPRESMGELIRWYASPIIWIVLPLVFVSLALVVFF